MSKRIAVFLSMLILFITALIGCDSNSLKLASNIEKVSTEDGIHYICDYCGEERDFSLYLPNDYKGSTLVVALHGYGSDADSFSRDTQLHETLVPKGYTVVYVSGIPDPDDKTSAAGWNSGLKDSGNDDAGFLSSLAAFLQKEFSLNDKRCVAVGYSNGAFMTHRLAIDENGIFTDIVSVAGMMPEHAWNMRPPKASVNVLQISGTKDDVVPQRRNGTDKYSKAPAIEDVMEYYVESLGLDKSETEQFTEKAEITRYLSDNNSYKVWEISVHDGRHSWYEEQFCGFVINDLIIEFLN